jgi:hypothetical protein
LTRGLINPYELNVYLYYQQTKRVEVYQVDIRQPRGFRKVNEINHVQDIAEVRFLNSDADHIKVIS